PNGSGKTTTLRMLCGLLTPDAGQGTCLDYDILTEQDEIKPNVGYMTQRFSLYADLSIRENLEFVARVYGLPDPRRAARDATDPLAPRGPPARARHPHRRAGAGPPRRPARGRALGRREAAPRAGRLHPAHPGAAAAL